MLLYTNVASVDQQLMMEHLTGTLYTPFNYLSHSTLSKVIAQQFAAEEWKTHYSKITH
jgi:hypothetical protein